MPLKPIVILMTRWPASGRCKSRLAKEIGSSQAAAIQNQLNRHTFAVTKRLEEERVIEIQLAVNGIAYKKATQWGKSQGIKTISHQGYGNLGLRMRRQILHAKKSSKNFRYFSQPTILIGTDLPTLSHRDLLNAIDALRNNEIVLGPSNDGGYWLIGLSRRLLNPVVKWPFCGIPWGTNKVLTKTLYQAKSAGACFKLLRLQNDLDTLEDMHPWLG